MKHSPDYSLIADHYDQRYQEDSLPGVSRLLRAIVVVRRADRIGEVACGTGHWLAQLSDRPNGLGIDRSRAMLQQASMKPVAIELVQADAGSLPLGRASIDLLFCVNALHHFSSPESFVRGAGRALAPRGTLLIVGANPHKSSVDWFVYRYFDGVKALDESRFPPLDQIERWLSVGGFGIEARGTAQPIRDSFAGPDVLETPFIQRRGCSQMALLSDQAYRAGIDRIRQAVARNPAIVFKTSIDLDFVLARRLAET
jgi:SAM-dependent methyltransferase